MIEVNFLKQEPIPIQSRVRINLCAIFRLVKNQKDEGWFATHSSLVVSHFYPEYTWTVLNRKRRDKNIVELHSHLK